MTEAKDLEVWFECAGTRLFAVERGAGTPVVFLHGGLADHRASLHRVGSLAAEHRLITPDLRGAGRSHHAGALDWDMLADDVAGLLDHLGLARAVIGGVSMGSGVALRFALRYPRRTRALLLLSPVYGGEGLTPAQASAMARMDAVGQRARVEGIAAILPLFAGLPPAIREVALAMARGFDAASVAATTSFLATGGAPFTGLAELATLDMPVLVVPGTDPEHPAEVAERYAATIASARLVPPEAPAERLEAFVGAAPP